MHGSTRANTHNGAREASQARRPAPARPWATAWPGWARSEPPRSTPWLPTAPAATPLPTRAAEPHGAALRERPEAAARAAGGAQRARRTPPAPVRAVAPSPAAATRARRPTTAVTADGGPLEGVLGPPEAALSVRGGGAATAPTPTEARRAGPGESRARRALAARAVAAVAARRDGGSGR